MASAKIRSHETGDMAASRMNLCPADLAMPILPQPFWVKRSCRVRSLGLPWAIAASSIACGRFPCNHRSHSTARGEYPYRLIGSRKGF